MPQSDLKPPAGPARRMIRAEWLLRGMAVLVFIGFAVMMGADGLGWDEAGILLFVALVLLVMLGVVAYARRTLIDLAKREGS